MDDLGGKTPIFGNTRIYNSSIFKPFSGKNPWSFPLQQGWPGSRSCPHFVRGSKRPPQGRKTCFFGGTFRLQMFFVVVVVVVVLFLRMDFFCVYLRRGLGVLLLLFAVSVVLAV